MKRAPQSLPAKVRDAFKGHPYLAVTSRSLHLDALNLERNANPENRRLRGIVRDMRRLSRFYLEVFQQQELTLKELQKLGGAREAE